MKKNEVADFTYNYAFVEFFNYWGFPEEIKKAEPMLTLPLIFS
jgi:hypothetical protein